MFGWQRKSIEGPWPLSRDRTDRHLAAVNLPQISAAGCPSPPPSPPSRQHPSPTTARTRGHRSSSALLRTARTLSTGCTRRSTRRLSWRRRCGSSSSRHHPPPSSRERCTWHSGWYAGRGAPTGTESARACQAPSPLPPRGLVRPVAVQPFFILFLTRTFRQRAPCCRGTLEADS